MPEVLQTISFFVMQRVSFIFGAQFRPAEVVQTVKFQLKGCGMCEAIENTSVDFCHVKIHRVVLDKEKKCSFKQLCI